MALTLNDALQQFIQSLSSDDLITLIKLPKATQRTQFQAFCDAQIAAANAQIADIDNFKQRVLTALNTSLSDWTAVRAQL